MICNSASCFFFGLFVKFSSCWFSFISQLASRAARKSDPVFRARRFHISLFSPAIQSPNPSALVHCGHPWDGALVTPLSPFDGSKRKVTWIIDNSALMFNLQSLAHCRTLRCLLPSDLRLSGNTSGDPISVRFPRSSYTHRQLVTYRVFATRCRILIFQSSFPRDFKTAEHPPIFCLLTHLQFSPFRNETKKLALKRMSPNTSFLQYLFWPRRLSLSIVFHCIWNKNLFMTNVHHLNLGCAHSTMVDDRFWWWTIFGGHPARSHTWLPRNLMHRDRVSLTPNNVWQFQDRRSCPKSLGND